jgi:hypothetical protein
VARCQCDWASHVHGRATSGGARHSGIAGQAVVALVSGGGRRPGTDRTRPKGLELGWLQKISLDTSSRAAMAIGPKLKMGCREIQFEFGTRF